MISPAIEAMKKLQYDYLTILKNAEKKFGSKDYIPILDESIVFWEKHKHIVSFFAEHYFTAQNTYIYMGPTLKFDQCDHYAFLLLGEVHILDDPFFTLMRSPFDKDIDEGFSDRIARLTESTIENNIKIIEGSKQNIIILPYSLLLKDTQKDLFKISEVLFLELFNNSIKNLEDYFELKTICDIEKALSLGYSEKLTFWDGENDELEFKTRFTSFQNAVPNSIQPNELFYKFIISYIFKALQALDMCLHYEAVPFIKSFTSLRYFLLIAQAFEEAPDMVKASKEVEECIFRCKVAYALHDHFDINRFKHLSDQSYVRHLTNCNSSEKFFEILRDKNINKDNMPKKEMVDAIEAYLADIYRI